ncbi:MULTISPECIES: glucose 1-dehydrogenase [unclassified Sinorhizobium]|uniref:SDR family NAD(P)-dependent oxidoreductase n=1 Tax=unclassified Sinorhizobium TaxID=2613772 RepID=UPI0024C260B0|nr:MULTISPECIES: glucose 1-dehydrogenase [unclassified Sinorhizobium]MDK1374295.1 glucose 1-dehydrogenase [Sinorhizobium sp. 6-70]MDK1479439.1 glucose 1-dehydrogenase [Sinorhizobium sp. 6-117]
MNEPKDNVRLAGKTVIITGAGTGIGAAAAHAFAREGASVVLVGRRHDVLEQTAVSIQAKGGTSLAIAGDVSRADDARRIVLETVQHFGRLDHLFNNAGIQGNGDPIVDMTEEAFDEIIAINLKGVWLMTKYALQSMLKNGTDCAIVNTSSFLSTAATAGTSAYSASKAGLDAMIRAIALEVGPAGIRINNINPGVIDTPMFRKHGDEIRAPLAAKAALKRLGTPEDIADVAVWLCTEEARFITGQSILVDGGFTIPGPR